MTAVLSAAGVERRFRSGAGAGPLDLEAGPGEVLALMGPNGSGKTTLLRLLATADRPARGALRWWGSDRRLAARRRIGYAPDEPADDPCLTPRQSTHFWCRQWLGPAPARERTETALAELGLLPVADEPLGTLSFGTRRRVGIAQALVHDPDLALLDEPTAGLDPGAVDALAAVLERRSLRGATTVVASNDPSFIQRAAERVAFLDAGRLLRLAATGELLAELPRRRVAELRLAAGGGELGAVPGVRQLGVSRDGWIALELDHDGVLPALVAAADGPGGRLAGLRLRHPDLRDSFQQLTGRALEEADG